jgi:hypothetical protein
VRAPRHPASDTTASAAIRLERARIGSAGEHGGDEQGRAQRAVIEDQQARRAGQRADDDEGLRQEAHHLAAHAEQRQAEHEHAAADDGGRAGGELEHGQKERDGAGARRDHAEAGEDVEPEMAGLLRGQRLEALGFGMGELAVFDELRQIECDFHGCYRKDVRNSPIR